MQGEGESLQSQTSFCSSFHIYLKSIWLNYTANAQILAQISFLMTDLDVAADNGNITAVSVHKQ